MQSVAERLLPCWVNARSRPVAATQADLIKHRLVRAVAELGVVLTNKVRLKALRPSTK